MAAPEGVGSESRARRDGQGVRCQAPAASPTPDLAGPLSILQLFPLQGVGGRPQGLEAEGRRQ